MNDIALAALDKLPYLMVALVVIGFLWIAHSDTRPRF